MASIKIHQDTCNFERRRLGLTTRQLIALAVAACILGASLWLLLVPLGVSVSIAPVLAVIPAMPAVIAGFAPLYGMPAEVFVRRAVEGGQRGAVITFKQEQAEIEEGEITRAHAKSKKRKGCERACGGRA